MKVLQLAPLSLTQLLKQPITQAQSSIAEVVQSLKSQIPDWRLLLQPGSPYLTMLKSLAAGQSGNFSRQNAFSNTHLWLIHHSFELVKPQGISGATLAVLARQPDGFYAALCRGILDADKKAPYNDPIFGRVPTWASHFYDPDSETNWLGQAEHTAVTCGSSYYDLAREAYLIGDLSAAGYYLGLSLHYLTDLTQPMHAANFTWFHSWQFGYHTSFEQYACHSLPSLTLKTTYQPLLPSATSASDFLREVARRTKDRFLESICRSDWVQSYNP
ncbi:MAG TPA: hypothetical protein VHL11_21955, partial [Phototrophicaceae bacterium]|nr:hypothetical protein [Phototrophicaceae bacterium]